MKHLVFRREPLSAPDYYRDDVARIVAVCKARGFRITETDAYEAWRDYSDSYAAGWMDMPTEDARLFDIVWGRCAVEESDV